MDSFNHVRPRETLAGNAELVLPEGSIYVYGTLEERSRQSVGNVIGVSSQFCHLKELGEARVSIDGDPSHLIDCSIEKDVIQTFVNESRSTVFLDITGLSHNVWAPLLRILLSADIDVRAVYMEPSDYAVNPNPFGGELFDLSEKIDGVKPLPGFVNFAEFDDELVAFVPLLGFEGARFAYILEQAQPAADRIYPVVGVPGFRFEYPFHTYQGNLRTLLSTRCWRNVRYVTAYCPFGIYDLLTELSAEHGFLRVAPIGTKPHALGAIMFAIKHHSQVELIYDHPKRKEKRTVGVGKRHVFRLTEFLRSL
ncbi:hypothetical protein [Azospirillum sp. TSH64]|uniref:hypothetical protein n=1 Tax=Azospirillum sp. TSH64 TaxID=652740 RepID=UPI0011B1E4B8|nr:hypothetical protein [Azospirillum sp. TSH64]